ncbi:MAG: nucleoside triphosphate pyrophosphohydrolase [Desulfosarcina sp.]
MADAIKPTRSGSIDPLLALIGTLRGETGCPWDQQQTPDSMAPYLIEEVYELVEAIISKDAAAVRDEAGDVLFQLLFVIDLYRESGYFDIQDVVDTNLEKMVRRHPHVFGDVRATTPAAVSANWERIKLTEKGAGDRRSVLGTVPSGLPALLRASKVSKRAAKAGFDWDDLSGVMAKAMEEWREFSNEIEDLEGEGRREKAAMEFGDILFTMVNVARFTRIHPETALIHAIQKFEKRFTYMETKAMESGRDFDSLALAEMHHLWEKAKDAIG